MTTITLKDLLTRILTNDPLLSSSTEKYSLSGEDVTDSLANYLATILPKNTTLQKLSLKGNKTVLSLQGWQTLLSAVLSHPSIRTLVFWDNALCLPGTKILADSFQQNGQSLLTELELRDIRKMDVEGIATLVDSLRQNQTLKKLTIKGTISFLHPEKDLHLQQSLLGESFRVFFQQNETLQHLDFHCRLGDTVTTPMTIGLQTNSSLKVLITSDRSLSNDGHFAIDNALRHNTSLVRFGVVFNLIDDEGECTILRTIQYQMRSLRHLQLAIEMMTTNIRTGFVDLLKYNTSLRVIDVVYKERTDNDSKQFLEALQYNESLRSFHRQRKLSIAKSN